MRNAWLIWKREWAATFFSPVAYVAMAAYVLLAGWTFLQAVEANVGRRESPETLFFVAVFFWLPLFATAITMRLFAEEKRSGTIEALMTAPVTDAQVVLGKFFGAFSFTLMAAAPAALPMLVLARMENGLTGVDAGAIQGGILIFVLIAALCTATGLTVSLVTRNQIVAAICVFGAICLPFLVRAAGTRLPVGSERVLDYLAAETHIVDFSRGSIDSRAIVLYATTALFLLFVSVKILESRRWR
jgi:ABC-2 type transport system permease protein